MNEPKNGNTLFEKIAEEYLDKNNDFIRSYRNPKFKTSREIFENSDGDRNEIRMVHEDRINDSFMEEINSIVQDEGILRTTTQREAMMIAQGSL